jgi:hypothetical protein
MAQVTVTGPYGQHTADAMRVARLIREMWRDYDASEFVKVFDYIQDYIRPESDCYNDLSTLEAAVIYIDCHPEES